MRTLVIVEVEVVLQRREQFEASGEVAGINQLFLAGVERTVEHRVSGA